MDHGYRIIHKNNNNGPWQRKYLKIITVIVV